MCKIKATISDAVDWIIKKLISEGYTVDINIESLKEIDRYFMDEINNIKKSNKPVYFQTSYIKDYSYKLYSIGSFVGEVIRTEYGGEWITDNVEDGVNIPLLLSNGSTIWPIHRIMTSQRNIHNYVVQHIGESKYTISKDKRVFSSNGKQIAFNDDIETVLIFPNSWVIHLENVHYMNGLPAYDMSKQPTNNIYGIDNECNILWNIKQITYSHLGITPDGYYNKPIKISDSVFATSEFRCINFDIDINTLEIVNKKFSK